MVLNVIVLKNKEGAKDYNKRINVDSWNVENGQVIFRKDKITVLATPLNLTIIEREG